MKKQKCGSAIWLILLIVYLTAMSCSGQETRQQVVRIGYVEIQGFLYQEEDGTYSGLAYDLLQEIASYNNWDYEFFACGYTEVAELFAQDELDLFVPYQKTVEREADYEYSDEVFCTNKASLLALPDSEIDYDDFSDLEGCTIGALKGTRNGERFLKYFRENDCHITVKSDYIHRQDLLTAAQNGEIDAFISASNRGITDYKIVAQLPQTDSYVIAPKGNRNFLDPLDRAIEKINLEMPSLIHILEEKYQNTMDGRYPSLSEEENHYIEEKKQVSVLIAPEECDADGNLSGSARVLFDHITELTGLKFVPVVVNGTADLMRDVTEGRADIVYTFNRDFVWADMHKVWVTCSYADFYNKLITKVGKTNIKKVSVVPGSYIAYWIQNNTNYETVECDSYAACLDAVRDGTVDAAYCNSPIGNYYSTFPKYSSLSFLSAFDMEGSYCMGVSKSGDQMLVDILNKAILCIPKSVLNKTYEIQMNSRQVTLIDIFYANPIQCMIIILVLTAICLILVLSAFYIWRIKKKNEQLAVANHAKTDFMSRMSHDMRTPMNGILGLAQLTRDETSMDVIRANLDQIELSGHVLLDLINDTLDMNKIEAGRLNLNLKPINSEEVFGNVLTNAKIMAAEKGVELQFHIPDIPYDQWKPVLADASRLEQIIINIISNAVKFTPSGGTVELIMDTLSIDDSTVKDRYIIRDHGIGMSPEFLPHMFDAFSQEKRDGKENKCTDQGTGLGMSIVKQLVTLMGGEIYVKSELNQGTEVTVLMNYPIYKGAIEEKEECQVSLDILKGKRALLCEDHPVNTQIAVRLLAKMGVQTDTAENGKLGLDMLISSTEHYYDFILMDIRMPVMNGIETAEAIRKLERQDAKRIPIIAITANAFEEDIRSCFEAGMNDHIAKPFDAASLYRTIAVHLGAE